MVIELKRESKISRRVSIGNSFNRENCYHYLLLQGKTTDFYYLVTVPELSSMATPGSTSNSDALKPERASVSLQALTGASACAGHP